MWLHVNVPVPKWERTAGSDAVVIRKAEEFVRNNNIIMTPGTVFHVRWTELLANTFTFGIQMSQGDWIARVSWEAPDTTERHDMAEVKPQSLSLWFDESGAILTYDSDNYAWTITPGQSVMVIPKNGPSRQVVYTWNSLRSITTGPPQ